MVKCASCGKEIPVNWTVCPACGVPQSQLPPKHIPLREDWEREVQAENELREGVYRPLFPPKPLKPISEECKEVLREYFRNRADFWVTSVRNTVALYRRGVMTRDGAREDMDMQMHYFVEDKGIVEDLFGSGDPLWGYFDKMQSEAQVYQLGL